MSDGVKRIPGAGDHFSRQVRVRILADSLVVNLAGGVVVEEGGGWVGSLTLRIEDGAAHDGPLGQWSEEGFNNLRQKFSSISSLPAPLMVLRNLEKLYLISSYDFK